MTIAPDCPEQGTCVCLTHPQSYTGMQSYAKLAERGAGRHQNPKLFEAAVIAASGTAARESARPPAPLRAGSPSAGPGVSRPDRPRMRRRTLPKTTEVDRRRIRGAPVSRGSIRFQVPAAAPRGRHPAPRATSRGCHSCFHPRSSPPLRAEPSGTGILRRDPDSGQASPSKPCVHTSGSAPPSAPRKIYHSLRSINRCLRTKVCPGAVPPENIAG